MLTMSMSRRSLLASATVAAAFGLDRKLALVSPAHAETPLEPTTGFYKYKVGSIEVTAVYDGIWRKPHHPTFIKNASVEETKAALAAAGLTTEFMPIPLTVIVLKIGDKHVMVDAGSGVGQWQANATHLPANMQAAGIDRSQISTILISHFHPDHVWGLMENQRSRFPQCRVDRQWRRIQMVDGARPGREIGGRPQARRQTHRRRFPDVEELETCRQQCRGRPGRPHSRCRRPHPRSLGFPGHVRQGSTDGVK
jgi:glyoxylase-like metal-dependent hydrolase (beta-lactamase superfamily II)